MAQVFYDFSFRHCVIALDFLSHFTFSHFPTFISYYGIDYGSRSSRNRWTSASVSSLRTGVGPQWSTVL